MRQSGAERFGQPQRRSGSSSCLPASGSLFSVGTTTVTCSAADVRRQRRARSSFTVTVNAAPDGRMFGVGQIRRRRKRRHRAFRVSQPHFRDNAPASNTGRTTRAAAAAAMTTTTAIRIATTTAITITTTGVQHRGDPAGRPRSEATEMTGAVFSDDPAFRPDHSRHRRPATDSVVFVGGRQVRMAGAATPSKFTPPIRGNPAVITTLALVAKKTPTGSRRAASTASWTAAISNRRRASVRRNEPSD